jgi:metal-responsive CopG/Arc/MetJ family transcriptional regulator
MMYIHDVCSYTMRRTQIYLPDEQTRQLDERAGIEGVNRSVLIRRAVDEYLARDALDTATWRMRWREAVQRTAGIAPYLSDGSAYAERLREGDVARLQELDR